ncbi:hypothetical protein FRB94_006935 [Tulasnella sp. JGI-2019a]|nr:hypothetical protein FRB94_006935 [Tulasnella sp. JGI-2019a]
MMRIGRVVQPPRNPPPLCQLPTELLQVIIGNLEAGDLQRLLQVCRTVKPVAELCLYQHIVIPASNRCRIAQLLNTLRDRDDLAILVLSFEGYLIPSFRFPNRPQEGSRTTLSMEALQVENFALMQMISDFQRLLAEVPNRMKNLRKVSMYDLEPRMSALNAKLLGFAASQLRLTHLEIRHPHDGLHSEFHPAVSREILLFLRQQPLLQHLSLPKHHQSLNRQQLLPSDILSLKSLDGVASDIMKIVPGRPVTSIDVCETVNEPTTELWAGLHTSIQPITRLTLCINRSDQLDGNLKSMVEHLTQLESLTLIGVRGDEDYRVTSANVRLFSSLRGLTVDLIYRSGFPKLDVWDGLHASCPNLERVSIIRKRAYYQSNVLNTNTDTLHSGLQRR